MPAETLALPGAAPGTAHHLTVHRFGTPGARPKVYVQAGLHANEAPGMLVAHHLLGLLRAGQAAGRMVGEVVVVPFANPVGLAQRVLGNPIGRFDLADGLNFNRGYPVLAPALAWTGDPAVDRDGFRAALLAANAARPAASAVQHLKRTLLGLALDADLVLDLHCDSQAPMHLYTLTPAAEAVMPLAALLGAQAVLLATESGGEPFDEACSRPWLIARQAGHAVPLACTAVTVELRGRTDVSHALAAADAAALAGYLTLMGVLAGPPPDVPPAPCRPTPLSACEPLVAPIPGVIAFLVAPGERVVAGQPVADIVDPASGGVAQVCAEHAGLVFSLTTDRFATAGHRLGEVAGTEAMRTGLLLTP